MIRVKEVDINNPINEMLKLPEDEFFEKRNKRLKPNFIPNGLATHHCHSNSDITVFDFLT